MMKSQFKLAEQHGSSGYYGEISVEVEQLESREIQIIWSAEVNGALVENAWAAGVNFGFQYAWEHTPQRSLQLPGVLIRIVEFKGFPIDTCSTVAAYIAAMALWLALGVTPKRPLRFSREERVFIFPK